MIFKIKFRCAFKMKNIFKTLGTNCISKNKKIGLKIFESSTGNMPFSDSGSEQEFSESEDDLQVTWTKAKTFKLAFGLYKDRRLHEMIKTKKRRNYLKYLLSWDKLRDITRKNIECALEQYEGMKKKQNE